MRIIQWTIWSILVALFLLNQYIERVLHLSLPFLHSYFDDLMAVPITLGTYQILVQDILKKSSFQIRISHILVCLIGFTFHFEILMPIISGKYTRDIIDILMYAVGCGLFVLSNPTLLKLPAHNKKLGKIF
jgi:hypothetical protein